MEKRKNAIDPFFINLNPTDLARAITSLSLK